MQTNIAYLSEAIKNERIDAQFFSSNYIKIMGAISNRPYTSLSDVAYITDGNHLKIAEVFDASHGIRYLRGQDLSSNMMLHDRNIVRIPESTFNLLERSHIRKGDILITIVGANTGLVGLVFNPPKKLVASCKLGITRPNSKKISSEYLYAFLTCSYGQNQITRSIRGGGQTGLILPDMRQLKITRLEAEFELAVAKVVNAGHQSILDSKEVYLNIQDTLLAELGLSNWRSQHCLTFIRYYSETQAAARIDAEYFQPKYQEIVQAIKNYAGGWDTLGNLVTVKKCVEVGSNEYLEAGIPFVRVSNLSPFEITEEKYISEELYEEIKQHQPQPGEILFSKDATPGIAHYLNEAPRKMIPSGGILRLKRKSDQISNEYLTLVLNSVLTKEQVNRDVGGSIILHWRTDQVKATAIPLLPQAKQHQIQQKVIESFNLRKQSKQLLECAKRAVELAIEQDEQTAINWLQDQMHSINPATTTSV